MDKFDKLIDKHFGVIMSHKAASVQHYLETGSISGTFRISLRHMLSDACGGGISECDYKLSHDALKSWHDAKYCPYCGIKL